MIRHPHHFKIAFALALSAGAWGIYWLPQRILVEGGLTGGWGTIAQMIIGFLILLPICLLYTSPSPRDRVRSRMPSSA